MKEETWFKWMVISTILHFIVITALTIPFKKSTKRIDLSSSYSVNLVGSLGGTGEKIGITEGRGVEGVPRTEPVPEKKEVRATPKKGPPPKPQRQTPVRREKEALSLSKKKVAQKPLKEKDVPSKDELSRLEERIREIKKRTEYFDVTKARSPVVQGGQGGQTGSLKGGSSGVGFGGEGGLRPIDPNTQRYILGVWERIKESWGMPGIASYKKDLETIVTIKIRKDGRIVDINMEKRSGNKIYDESILRVLRSVDPLPPLPSTVETDTIEIGFRFLPGELS
ncbi:MAG: TonB C-terminal domain-containing protein [Syntrophorhabdaceae bacterium]|nr:TonB C-terminal domain-containing protein [Syntrophorhabdaceae bacterium]